MPGMYEENPVLRPADRAYTLSPYLCTEAVAKPPEATSQ